MSDASFEPDSSAREQFLSSLLEQLTQPAPLSDESGTSAMLRDMANMLNTTGAYVIMLEQTSSGGVNIDYRHAWYAKDVRPLSFGGRGMGALSALFKRGPLLIPDSQLLPEAQKEFADELESRGLRAALMLGVFVDDDLRGFVGFNDQRPRAWSAEEIALAEQLSRSVIWTLDKQLSERKLQAAEARIRSFIEESPIPMYCWEFDPPIDTSLPVAEQLKALDPGILVECNETFAKDFGLDTVENALGKTYAEVSQVNPEGFKRQLTHFLENGHASQDFRDRADLPDGRRVYYVSNATGFIENGLMYRIWGNSRNVTEAVVAEQQIQASRERINLALEAGGVGFFEWRLDNLKGSVEFPSALRGLPNYRFEDATVEEIRELMTPQSIDVLQQAWDAYNAGEQERLTAEITLKPYNGKMQTVLLQGKTLSREDGDVVVAVLQDITQIRESQAAQAQLEEQMRIAQKLESLGLLAGGIAHDFNNLLMVVLGNADLVERDLQDDTVSRERVAEISKAARVASELCRQLLAYAGKGSFVLENIDPPALVESMRGLLESSISRRISLRFNFNPTPTIVADASQIQQVLLNLVINAGEAIGDAPGEIMVSTGALDCTTEYLAEPYLDDDLPSGKYSYIEVTDTGSGMTEEVRRRLFDPFFTTKFTGRGLGMSAVLGIVRSHKGSMKIYSEPGRGTNLRVLFPTDSKELIATKDQANTEAIENLPGGKILFIDDELLVRNIGTDMLSELGFSTICAQNGVEALELFDQHRHEIVAVILDLTMPEMDGIATFRELKKRSPDLQVILASGYNEQEATRDFVGRGLAAFIQKPFVMSELERILHKVLPKD